VESKLKPIAIRLLSARELAAGNTDKTMFKLWWTQMGKNSHVKDLKKRILDTLHAAGMRIEDSDVRVWLY